jgi:DNA-binding NarL/FixJ family response regulator
MHKILSKPQRDELIHELKVERSRHSAELIKVILLLDQGESHSNISKFLFLDEATINNYENRYRKEHN